MQTTSRGAYYGAHVYDIWDDRVHDASEMLREWKGAKWMDKDTISLDRFNAGYIETFKTWSKDNIQSISSPMPRSFHTIKGKEAKVVIDLREVKCEAQEMYNNFIENKDALEKSYQEVE